LTVQAHPSWSVADIKKAIVNTGEPSEITGLTGHRISRGGTGLVQPQRTTKTSVVAGSPAGDGFDVSVNFGFQELKANFSQTKPITLHNYGASPATFNVAQANAAGSAHSVGLPGSVTVPAGGDATINVTLNVPVTSIGNSTGSGLSFREVAGLVTFTPTGGANSGIALRVPYYLVPRALSEVKSTLQPGFGGFSVRLANTGAITGTADFYALGLEDGNEAGASSADVRAIGAQAFDFDAANQFIGFSVNTYDRWSNPSTSEFDIFVDVDNDGTDDYIVVGVDQGAIQAGVFNGRMGSFVFSTRSPGASINFLAQAPTDASTANIFILSTQLCRTGEPCLSPSNPRFRYTAVSFDLVSETADPVSGSARFNPFNPAFGDFPFVSVPAGAAGNVSVPLNVGEWSVTKPRGLMVTVLDDKAGTEEADLLPIR
jgi:minor extracellular serine protease Vpr